MKNKILNRSALTLLFALMFQFAFSQSALRKANELYNQLAYSEAIVEYETALKKNPDLQIFIFS